MSITDDSSFEASSDSSQNRRDSSPRSSSSEIRYNIIPEIPLMVTSCKTRDIRTYFRRVEMVNLFNL